MAEQKKRGRPAKTAAAEPVAEPTPTANESTADLKARIEMLERALLQKAAEAEALRIASRSGGGERVVLENTGMVQVVIPIEGEPDLVLDAQGFRKTGSVPVHVYNRLLRDTTLFQKGYIVRVDDPNPNPNVIRDPQEWFDRLEESEIRDAVAKITSEGTFHILWNFLDTVEQPTGKHLLLRKAITARVRELFDYNLVEDETGD